MAETVTQRTTKARARVEALFRAFNEHDVDKIVALHAPDAVWQAPNLAEPVTGHDAIALELRRLFRAFPDLHFVMDELEVYTSGADRAASRWHSVGTMTGPIDPPGFAPTGKQGTINGACFYTFQDGLLQRHTIIYDTMDLLVQLGIMPAATSPAGKVTVGIQRALAELGRRMPTRSG